MIIKSKFKDYEVNIFSDFSTLDEIKIDNNSFMVIDKNVYNLYKDSALKNLLMRVMELEKKELHLMLLDAEEENKTLDTAMNICEKMTEMSSKRNSHLISIGGGIVQDITGFVANVLYRGIKWTFFPTTLLAACDSCIGGKTSLNYKKYKNLLGTFYPPDKIQIYTPFLNTLTTEAFNSGMGEVVKFNVMRGKSGIDALEKDIEYLKNRDETLLVSYIKNSLLFKKTFIEQDEFDQGVRIYLNFAHTFGHAFEVVSNYRIPHGTAVAMGTIVANNISVSRNMMNVELANRIQELLRGIIHIDKNVMKVSMNEIIDAMHKDKKQTGENLTAVLINGSDMSLHVVKDIEEAEVSYAIGRLMELELN